MTRAAARRWTADERDLLRRLYPGTATSASARELDRPVSHVFAQAQHLGLRKSPAYLASALSGRMQPGAPERVVEQRRIPSGTVTRTSAGVTRHEIADDDMDDDV